MKHGSINSKLTQGEERRRIFLNIVHILNIFTTEDAALRPFTASSNGQLRNDVILTPIFATHNSIEYG